MTRPDPRVEDRRARPAVSGRARHLGVALVAIAIGAGMLALASSLPESTVPTAFPPQWWPAGVGAAVVALGLVLLIRPSEHEDDAAPPSGTARMLGMLGCAIGGLVLWLLLGFVVAVALMSAALLLLLGARRPLAVILLPTILAGSLFLFFDVLLKVPL